MATGTFGGFISAIAGGSTAYVFAGPTVVVTVAAGQRITGAAEAPVATSTGTTVGNAGLCYQPTSGGALTNFVGGLYSIIQWDTLRSGTPASASVVPGAGTYNVGFCIQNSGTNALNSNDFVNGWVIVTN